MQPQREFMIVTGFGDKGIAEFASSLQDVFSNATISIVPGCPVEKASEKPNILIDHIRSELRKRIQEVILMGHSYGALLALVAACREKLRGISNLILVDGPLHPNVEVKPVNGFLKQFQMQYSSRVRLALECLETLPSLKTERVVTLGTQNDRIVPGEAKSLPGIRHIKLPEKYQGHDLIPKIEKVTNFIVDFLDHIKAP